MSYAKEDEIEKKKRKRLYIVILFVLVFIFVALTVVSCFYPIETWKYYVNLPKTGQRADGELRLHFVDVGQGDATIIEFPDGKIALVDGGDDTEKTKTTLLRYLNALQIDAIDYLIVTHTDADHCGGLDTVVKHKRIVQAFVPDNTETVGLQYQEFFKRLEKEKDCAVYSLMRKRIRGNDGDAYTFSLLYPYATDLMDDNLDNNATSGVVWLEYQNTGAVLMGDAPATVETALVTQAKNGLLREVAPHFIGTEIIKLSHHGANTATSGTFLDYIQAKTAVISCGENNLYGHPAKETMERLSERDIQTYRTDTQGHIIITVNSAGYTAKTLSK